MVVKPLVGQGKPLRPGVFTVGSTATFHVNAGAPPARPIRSVAAGLGAVRVKAAPASRDSSALRA
jgi:hypothetical protein